MTNLKSYFAVQMHSNCLSFALLITRILVGYAFIQHGYGKILHAFVWMGPTSTMPGALQALAAFAEFGGGIALILGLLTSLSTLGLISTMAVAIYFHAIVFGDPLVSTGAGGSYELAAVYLALSILIFVAGPGKYSLDRFLFGAK